MRFDAAQHDFDELNDAYNRAVISGDHDMIARALAIPIPESIRERPELHGLLRNRRGNTFSRIGQIAAAEREYELGFFESALSDKGDYLLDWAMGAFTLLFIPTTPPREKEDAARRCLDILHRAEGFADDLPDPRYLLASTSSVRALLLVRAGETAAAGEQLARITSGPLRPGFHEDQSLSAFFTQSPKGLFAALELKDADLLRQVAAALLTEAEEAALRARPASAGEAFLFMLSARMDVPKFRDSWTALLGQIHVLFPGFPITRRFRAMLNGGAQPADIIRFIDSLH
jgi:hypothetical protein